MLLSFFARSEVSGGDGWSGIGGSSGCCGGCCGCDAVAGGGADADAEVVISGTGFSDVGMRDERGDMVEMRRRGWRSGSAWDGGGRGWVLRVDRVSSDEGGESTDHGHDGCAPA